MTIYLNDTRWDTLNSIASLIGKTMGQNYKTRGEIKDQATLAEQYANQSNQIQPVSTGFKDTSGADIAAPSLTGLLMQNQSQFHKNIADAMKRGMSRTEATKMYGDMANTNLAVSRENAMSGFSQNMKGVVDSILSDDALDDTAKFSKLGQVDTLTGQLGLKTNYAGDYAKLNTVQTRDTNTGGYIQRDTLNPFGKVINSQNIAVGMTPYQSASLGLQHEKMAQDEAHFSATMSLQRDALTAKQNAASGMAGFQFDPAKALKAEKTFNVYVQKAANAKTKAERDQAINELAGYLPMLAADNPRLIDKFRNEKVYLYGGGADQDYATSLNGGSFSKGGSAAPAISEDDSNPYEYYGD